MAGQEPPLREPFAAAATPGFPRLGARRLLVMGGLALILAGMIFGDVFAVFVLHQNAARASEKLWTVTEAVAAGDVPAVAKALDQVSGFLENRGTKVDAHVHMIDFGYLALLLALMQPLVALDERWKKRLAWWLLAGGIVLPVGVFLIHYVGLEYSPFADLGWASVVADLGGLLALIAVTGELVGLARHFRGKRKAPPAGSPAEALADAGSPAEALAEAGDLLAEGGRPSRWLLVGGTLLILAGFLHGAYFALAGLDANEAQAVNLLDTMASAAAANRVEAFQAIQGYAALGAVQATQVAAHAHIIEFGLLAILLAFFQPYVFLSEQWKRIWVALLLAGSVILPVFVLLELRLGLAAGGIADAGGLLVALALVAMLAGIVRYSGRLDAETETERQA
jgi:hypothetical protein